MMNFLQTKTDRLLAFYDGVRRQVELDKQAGGRYQLAGDGVKQYAEKLREEMERRRLRFERLSGRAERQTTSHNPESAAKRSGGRRSSTRRFRLCF